MASYEDKSQGNQGAHPRAHSHQPTAGKQTLVEQIIAPLVQQRAADPHDQRDETAVHAVASRGVATPASPLPFSDTLQRVFGRRDVSSIQTHTGLPPRSALRRAAGTRRWSSPMATNVRRIADSA